MRKILLFVVALLFVTANINAEKLTGTLSSNMNAYSTWTDEYPSSNANDGNYSTKFWSDASQEVGDYVTMSLNASASIGEIKLYFADGDKPAAAEVEISTDNSEWQSVATFVTSDIVDGVYTCNANALVAQYVRLRFTQASSNWFQLCEFEVYESPVELAPRTISVSVADETMGTAYIGEEGTLSVSDQTSAVQITAVPAEGYKFVNWTIGTDEVATTATFVDVTEGDKAYVANFAAKEVYQVSVSVNDETMGTALATKTGDVYEGESVTFTATPKEGYVLLNWTSGEEIVSDELSFTTTISESVEYKANFMVQPTKLVLQDVFASFPESSYYPLSNLIDGNINSEMYVTAGSGATVTVEIAEESVVGDIVLYFYKYSSYQPSKAKIQVSSDNETYMDVDGCSFTKEDLEEGVITLKANGVPAKYVRIYFEETNYVDMYEIEVYEAPIQIAPRAISVSVADATMGTAYIGEEGTTSVENQTGVVKLVAVANKGYEFVNWTVGTEVVSTNAIFIDRTEGDKDYVANFVALPFFNISVSVNDSLMGSVTATETGEVYENTEITLTATPTDGYEFVNWTVGDSIVSKDNPYVITVEASAEYKANFRIAPTKINLVNAESSMEHYYSNTADNMIDGNYNTYFDTAKGQGTYEEVTATVTLEEESIVGEVKINFIQNYIPNAAKLQVSTDGEVWNDVEGAEFTSEDVENCGTIPNGSIINRITVDLKGATAKYVRMYATDKAGTYLTICEFEVYEAIVNVAPRAISVFVNDETMGTAYIAIEGVTEVTNQTAAVKLVAVPSAIGYKFVNWTVNGEEVSTSASFIDRTEGDKAYVANFMVKPQFAVSATSANESKGTVTVSQEGDVYEGEEVTFTATPTDGYKFVAWKSGEEVVSESASYTVTVSEPISLVATFERDPMLNRSEWTVTASSQEASGEGAGNGVASCIIDGSNSTYWHSQWSGSEPGYPHWFMIDMKEVKSFDEFEYISRGNGTSDDGSNNGNILNYVLYVSNTEIDPNNLDAATKVTEGRFTYDGTSNSHKVAVTPAEGRYVMLYATGQSANGRKNASCVEFYLYSSSYAVTVSSSDPEIGTAYIGEEGVTTVGCSVEGTDVVTITAQPVAGYRFVSWMLNGEVVSNDAVYTTTEVTESREYVATFEFATLEPRTVKVASNDKTKGYAVFVSPMPEGTATDVTTGEIVTVEAIAQSSDDFFVNWTINGVAVGTEPTYEYLGAEAATIQANFISKYTVTIDQVAGGTISVKSGGTFVASGDRVLEGNYITLDVEENSGSQLKKLFINGEDVFIKYRYNPDYCVQVNGPITITAEYGEPVCIFTYECTGNGWIEAWETDTYDEVAEEEGTLELPLSPAGVQYAYGDAIPFGGTAAIFPMAGDGDSLVSLTINDEEIEMSEEGDIAIYGDYFLDPVDAPIHVVAVFTGTSTGVESAEITETSIYAVAGGVQVEVAEATTVSVYSVAGTLVAEQQVSESAVIALEKGVYIVKAAEKVVKVVVK